MCFYASLTFKKIIGNKLFGATFRRKDDWDPLYFVSGFDHPQLPVIAFDQRNVLQPMRWGLVPHFVKTEKEAAGIQNLTLNAKAETLTQRPAFKSAVAQGRCIIPVSGFFEWQHVGGRKIPYFVFATDREPMAFAGIYDFWKSTPDAEPTASFSIITTEANTLMAKIHNTKKRMPVVLPSQTVEEWLNPDRSVSSVVNLLLPAADGFLSAYRIAPDLLNSGFNRNIPDIVEPYNSAQGRLFE